MNKYAKKAEKAVNRINERLGWGKEDALDPDLRSLLILVIASYIEGRIEAEREGLVKLVEYGKEKT